MLGRIHSLESFSTQDGPGLRQVVFFQGCHLRCKYCHNPDSWSTGSGEITDSQELLDRLIRFRHYSKNGGGITISGGEPLQQPEFLLELLYHLKRAAMHTALDTSGWPYDDSRDELLLSILSQTDLLIIDIKAATDKKYIELTGKTCHGRDYLLEKSIICKKEVLLRQVVVPEYNTNEADLKAMSEWIINWQKKGLLIKKIDLLPYHTLAADKYKQLGQVYEWNSYRPAEQDDLDQYTDKLKTYLKSSGSDRALLGN